MIIVKRRLFPISFLIEAKSVFCPVFLVDLDFLIFEPDLLTPLINCPLTLALNLAFLPSELEGFQDT